MILYAAEVKDSSKVSGTFDTTLRCRIGGRAKYMQNTLESLLVALLVTLNPADTDSPGFTPEEGPDQAVTATAKDPPAPVKVDAIPNSCRYYVDPAGRRNCILRTSRAMSGSAEASEFPSQTVWVAPEDRGMPFRFQLPNAPR